MNAHFRRGYGPQEEPKSKRKARSNRTHRHPAQRLVTLHAGKRQVKCTATPHRAAALRIAANLETDAALRKVGVVDSQQESLSAEAR